MRLKCLAGTLFFFLITSHLPAEDPVDTGDLFDMPLEELLDVKVTTASKISEKIKDAPSNITIITEQLITEWGAHDLADILKRIVGYQVVADRDEFVLAARGNVSDNNQKYLMLIDGHRMNSIENFRPCYLLEMPGMLANVKRIEVIRGPGSAVWGADALAGVINIITKEAKDMEGQCTNIGLTLGQDNLTAAHFQVGQQVTENFDFILSGTFARSHGRKVTQHASTPFPILDTKTGFHSHPYGTYSTRLNRVYPSYQLQLKAHAGHFTFNSYVSEMSLFNRHFESDRGRVNVVHSQNSFINGTYQNQFNDWNVAMSITTFLNNSEFIPQKQGDAKKLPVNILWRDRGVYTDFNIAKPFGKNFLLTTGLDYTFTNLGPNHQMLHFNPDFPARPVTGFWHDRHYNDHQVGGYVNGNVHMLPWFSVYLGTRLDYNKQRGDDHFTVNPRAALMFYPLKHSTFKLIYNRGYLRPTNHQAMGGCVNSEIMHQVDFVWLHDFDRLTASLTAYWQRLEGIILVLPSSFGFTNTGDYSSRGLELEFLAPLGKQFTWWGNANYSLSSGHNFPHDLNYNSRRIDLDGNLLNHPNYKINAGFMARFLGGSMFVSPSVRYVPPTTFRMYPARNRRQDSWANYSKTSAFTFINLNIGFQPWKQFEFSVYAENLLNITDPVYLSVWNSTIEQYGRHLSAKLIFHY